MAKRLSAESLPPYEVTRPDEVEGLPPVAAFYSQQPIGVDTPDVESLESYSVRLAAAHRVPRHTLHESFVERTPNGEDLRFVKVRSVDGPTEKGKGFADALARLTGVPAVAHLGLHPFRGSLGNHRVFKPMRAWCGACFEESRKSGVPAYWRLLWSLSITQVCPHHGLFLQTQCPSCGREFSPDGRWEGLLDACPYCHSDLAASANPTGTFEKVKARERATASVFDGLASSLSAELVAVGARVSREGLSVEVGVARVVQRLDQLGFGRSPGALGKHAGLAKSTMHALDHSLGGACLPNLARLAAAAQISLAGILVPDLWRVNPEDSFRPSEMPSRPARRFYDWDQIRAELSSQERRYEDFSSRAVAAKLGMDLRHFQRNLKDLIPRLKDGAAAHRRQRFEERASHLALQIVQKRRELVNECKYASQRRVAAQVKVGRHCKHFQEAWTRSLEVFPVDPMQTGG